jgi:hypothetical protein
VLNRPNRQTDIHSMNNPCNPPVLPVAQKAIAKGGLIEIEELDTPARCGVIANEIGQIVHRTNREGTTRQQRELEAESVSYAVLAHFGIHSESRFYLATYNRRDADRFLSDDRQRSKEDYQPD